MRHSIFAVALGLAALCAVPASALTLTHAWELNGSFADQFGGPAMNPNGGALGATGYSFAAGQGLNVSNAIDPNDYSIWLRFDFDTTSGFRRIIEFKNLAADTGLYNLNTALNFFGATTGPGGAINNDQVVDVVLTRDDATDTVNGYVNGVLQISFNDGSGLAIFSAAGAIAHFFQDDLAFGAEASSGFADFVRFYDEAATPEQLALIAIPGQAAPEPLTLGLLGTGLIGLAAARRRRPTR